MAPQTGTAIAATNPTGPLLGEPPPDIPRDRWGRPRIRSADNPRKLVAYTRASTLGGVLEDQYGLGQWRMRQVLLGASRRKDIVVGAAAIPLDPQGEDKKTLGELAEKALEAAESDAKATIGTALHALAEQVDAGQPVDHLPEEYQATLAAYAEAMAAVEILASETFVVCDAVSAAGTFDRLVRVREGYQLVAPDGTIYGPGSVLIVDLKTSSTADYFGIKFAVQLAIYGHGVPYCHARGRMDWEHVPDRRWALILHMPSGGTVAEWYWVDLEAGLDLAHKAVIVQAERRRKDLVRPAIVERVADPEAGRRALEAIGAGAEEGPLEPDVPIAERAPVPDTLALSIGNAINAASVRCLRDRFAERWTPAHDAAAADRTVDWLRTARDERELDGTWSEAEPWWTDALTEAARARLAELGAGVTA